jgi:predicted ATPase
MRISIENFKSIGSIANYEIKPFTILSGTNSSGKSSFIQLLLLLKQTIEQDSGSSQLYLDGNLFQVKKFRDILWGKSIENNFKVSFQFDKQELKEYSNDTELAYFDSFEKYRCRIVCLFDISNNLPYLKEFSITFLLDEGEKREQYIKFINNINTFSIETNTGAFGEKLYFNQGNYKISNISYTAFFPTKYSHSIDENHSIEVPKIDGIKAAIYSYFKSLNYIGPLREQPRDEYKATGNNSRVGKKGEYVAEVLETHSPDTVSFYKLVESNDSFDFLLCKSSLIEAVKFWMCEKFKLCSDVIAVKEGDSLSIYIVSNNNIRVTINHVGFGVSQILPIIVEGLILNSGETLVLEQPEIHLHPKIQSALYDFLIALVQDGKSVIIETHSDHLITRLRRRIAEDSKYSIIKNMQLTFIESGAKDLIFRNIGIDELGTFDYFPDDFIEKQEVELKAILKAQMKKRLNSEK